MTRPRRIPALISRAFGLDRAHQDAPALDIAERIGQVRREVLQLQPEKPLGLRAGRFALGRSGFR